MAINTGTFPKGLVPGVKKFFEDAKAVTTEEWSRFLKKESSNRLYEEYVSHVGFGLAPVKNELANISYDTARQGFTTRLTNVVRGLGFIISHEAQQDGRWGPAAKLDAQSLRKSFSQAKENVAALILSRATTSGYTGGDGVVLASASHPNKSGGVRSNIAATSADISEVAIEAMITQIMTATNDRGLAAGTNPVSLLIAPADLFNATRILKSVLQGATANNAVNAVKTLGLLGNIITNRYYNAGVGAWGILTDEDGLVCQEREALSFDMDTDKGTRNLHFMAFERYAMGWYNPFAIFWNPGA